MNERTIYVSSEDSFSKLFSEIKSELLKVDPVAFTENYLKLDGEPFKVSGSGWKFMADIYRYIALKAINPDGKPIVILKGRQVGATVMAGALDLYFTASGLFGGLNHRPITVLHCFPDLSRAKKFSQVKLDSLINTAVNDYINQQKIGYNPKTKKISADKPDNITLKQFKGGCNLWIESLGNNSDRIRGISCDAIFFDECFPYQQNIETEHGKIKIGTIYNMFKKKKELPRVKTYNEKSCNFEYKKVINAWKRGERELIQLTCGNREIKCTPNHKLLTTNGWKRADELKIGEGIKTSNDTNLHVRALNDDQLQVILGSFLGDGHLSNSALGINRYRLIMTHGIDQKEYCDWKMLIFNGSSKVVKNNGFSKKLAARGQTKTFYLPEVLPKTKISCPDWVLKQMDLRGIAIWYMDDGTTNNWKTGASGKLCTCSFDEASQKLFVDKFKSIGIDCKYRLEDNYYYIIFNKDNFIKLSNLMKPYFHKTMSYKLFQNDDNQTYIWNNNFKQYGMTIIDKVKLLNKKEIVYDIEVEDNHNFIITSGPTSKNLGGPIAHNCQDMYSTAIGVALKTLTASKYGQSGKGIQVYLGTPKAKGSYFETSLWDQTDKRYYFLGCTNKDCGEYFMLSTPGTDEWKKIWLFGQTVKCPKCGNEDDKRVLVENGKWIPTEPYNKDKSEKKFIGYHISQLYVPHLDKNYILDQHPDNNKSSSERIYYNEALGEFYSGSDMPIARDEIETICKDPERAFSRIILPSQRKTWMGIDWGGKIDEDNADGERRGGQSYSCVTIISADSTGTISIEFAYRMRSTDLQYKMEFVKEMYKNYNLQLTVADWGYGHDVCNELQKVYGSKFISAETSGVMKKNVTFDSNQLRIHWNKDYYIEELFDLMRKGKVRFPWKSFEKMDWLIDHITSMEVQHTMVGGMPKKKYIKGAMPNDGFMALIYAYLAYKFEISGGFSVNLNNPNQSAVAMPKLIYLPKFR